MAKLFVILAIVCVMEVVLGQGDEFLQACKAELGATDADVQKLLSEKEPVLSEKGKCLEACHMKKMGTMDSNGKFAKSAAIDVIKKSGGDSNEIKKVTEVINACAGISVPGESCANAKVYRKCIIEESEKRGMNVI